MFYYNLSMASHVERASRSHERRVAALASIRRQRAGIDAHETRLLAVMAADPLPSMDGSPALNKHWVREDDGGTTSAENLHPLRPRHHRLKHETRWRVRRECDGTTRWTSPTGRIYQAPVRMARRQPAAAVLSPARDHSVANVRNIAAVSFG